MRITLKQLGVFAAVARYGTVTRAAHELNFTQSAASMALADLETQLASQLFDRTGKRLQLNDLGRKLLPTVITTAVPVEELDPRLASRMLDGIRCTFFVIEAPSYRGKSSRGRRAASRRG